MRKFGDSWERIFFQREESDLWQALSVQGFLRTAWHFLKSKFVSWSSHGVCPGECGKANKHYLWIFYVIGVYSDGFGSYAERLGFQRETKMFSFLWHGALWVFGALSLRTFFIFMTPGITSSLGPPGHGRTCQSWTEIATSGYQDSYKWCSPIQQVVKREPEHKEKKNIRHLTME